VTTQLIVDSLKDLGAADKTQYRPQRDELLPLALKDLKAGTCFDPGGGNIDTLGKKVAESLKNS